MIRLGLDRVRRALSRLGHPEEAFASVIIAGTNGKGSVSALVESAARAAGIRTGHYTSPHLADVRERVRVNGRMIPPAAWRRLIKRAAHPSLTEFERQTIAAFLYFAEEKVDLAVVEVGLGGRLDAVNSLPAPEAVVITSIGHDHMDWLGPTLGHVYFEKRGVARPGVPVVQAPPKNLWPAGDRHYRAEGIPAWTLDREIRVRRRGVQWGKGRQVIDVDMPGASFPRLVIPFLGDHQVRNAALAAALCRLLRTRGWPLTEKAVRDGFRRARWPGRFQVMPGRRPVVLDGAHNLEAAQALARTWRAAPWGKRPATLVFGCLKDKDAAGIARTLKPLVRRVVLTPLPSSRSRSAGELKPLWKGREMVEAASARAAFHAARAGRDPILVTGSLYLVGEAMKVLKTIPQ